MKTKKNIIYNINLSNFSPDWKFVTTIFGFVYVFSIKGCINNLI